MNASLGRSKKAQSLAPGPRLQCRLMIDGVVVERVGVVVRCYSGDVLALEATDAPGLMPRYFFVREGADWERLLQWVLDAWEHPRLGVPPGFAPLKKIPSAVLERLYQMDLAGRRRVFAELRQQGYLPKLASLSLGALPPQVSRSELAGLCLLAPGEQAGGA